MNFSFRCLAVPNLALGTIHLILMNWETKEVGVVGDTLIKAQLASTFLAK